MKKYSPRLLRSAVVDEEMSELDSLRGCDSDAESDADGNDHYWVKGGAVVRDNDQANCGGARKRGSPSCSGPPFSVGAAPASLFPRLLNSSAWTPAERYSRSRFHQILAHRRRGKTSPGG